MGRDRIGINHIAGIATDEADRRILDIRTSFSVAAQGAVTEYFRTGHGSALKL
jgi:hypothetical protein